MKNKSSFSLLIFFIIISIGAVLAVDVDAVLFWKVIDPKKAALEVADYESAIGWASQTALRDVIGKTMLSDMLEGRNKISNEMTALTMGLDQKQPGNAKKDAIENKPREP